MRDGGRLWRRRFTGGDFDGNLVVAAFFAESLLIETIFSLDGLGLLGFESIINRDYPVVFGTLYIFSLMGLVIALISDLIYAWVDPRIDFASREV